jgi:hypothetical protein
MFLVGVDLLLQSRLRLLPPGNTNGKKCDHLKIMILPLKSADIKICLAMSEQNKDDN